MDISGSTNLYKYGSLKFRSAKTILNDPPKPVTWVWEYYIAKGDFFIFVAYPKVGKSTFIYPMCLAISRGEPFLGRKTHKCNVAIITVEEHKDAAERRLLKLGMTRDDRIFVHAGSLPSTPLQVKQLGQWLIDNNIGFAILDSLAYWWGVNNENDNAEIIRLLLPLFNITRELNIPFGVVHHENKYGGRDLLGRSTGDGKSLRGGSSSFGMVEQLISLDKTRGGNQDKKRVLRTLGRHTTGEMIIELWGNPDADNFKPGDTPEPYGYTCLGTLDEFTEDAVQEKVSAVINEQPKGVDQIVEETGLDRKVVDRALKALVENEDATRNGEGKKGSPYTYSRRLDS